jgi:hypothetical protein
MRGKFNKLLPIIIYESIHTKNNFYNLPNKVSTMRYFFTFLFITVISCVYGQDITGIWRGHFRSSDTPERLMSVDDRYKFEVQIAQHAKGFEAITYSYLSSIFYGKAIADGTVNEKTQKVLLRELKIVELRMIGGDACNMTCFLKYSKLGDEEFLEGTYTSMNTHDSSSCGKGTVFLRKVPNSDFYKEPFLEKREKEMEHEKKKIAGLSANPDKKAIAPPPLKNPVNPANPVKKTTAPLKKPLTDSSGLAKNRVQKKPLAKKPQNQTLAKARTDQQPVRELRTDSSFRIQNKPAPNLLTPEVLTNRKNELVKTIIVNTNEVELNIYDDGAIDNDTVSVYIDKKLVVAHAMLTDRAIVVKLHMDDENNYHEVVMVADNEGEIPPNTSLMIVKAGDKRYEVRIVSTEQKNATVIFKFEKDK